MVVLVLLSAGCSDSAGPSTPAPLAGKVVFASLRGGTWGLWYAAPDGSGATRIPLPPSLVPQDLDVSPDGKRVAFSADNQVWVVDWDGGNLRSLSGSVQVNRFPRWAPDGQTVVFSSTRSGPWDLWLTEADPTGPPSRITMEDPFAVYPVWRPDGQQIVFACAPDDEHGLCTYDLAAGRSDPLLSVLGDDIPLDWWPGQPDLVTWSQRPDSSGLPSVGLYRVNPGTGEVELLSADPGIGRWARVSPTGDRLILDKVEPDASTRVYFLPADGGVSVRAFDAGVSDAYPAWGPPL